MRLKLNKTYYFILALIIFILVLRIPLSTMPFSWALIFLLLGIGAYITAIRAKKRTAIYSSLVISSFFVVLAAGEGWFYLQQLARERSSFIPLELQDKTDVADLFSYGSNHYDDPVLGRGPLPKKTRTAAKRATNNETVYDVIYTTLDSGWRITPQHEAAETAVLFFGCSFTIGEGLNDEESYPYRVGEILGSDYQVFNFGFHGYGSHQMLAMIESGRLDDILKKYKNVIAFYMTIDRHELRSGGYATYDKRGPRYVLAEDTAIRQGTFYEHRSSVKASMDRLFGRSALYNKLMEARITALPELIQLHAAIIARSSDILKEKYNAPFTTILWPNALAFKDDLDRRDIALIDLSVSMPDYVSDPLRYAISPLDTHPNAYAANLVAETIAAYIRENRK